MEYDFNNEFKKAFKDPENIDLEEIKALSAKAKEQLELLEKSLDETDSSEKKEALGALKDLKALFEEQSKSFMEQMDLAEEEFHQMTENPPSFSEEEEEAISEISNNLKL